MVLVIAYIVLAQENRSTQADVNRRQQFINQSIQLGRINDNLIRTIAMAAIKDKDDKLRGLLTRNGITINMPMRPGGTKRPPQVAAPTPKSKPPATSLPPSAPAKKAP
ncbi:MAG: hypothetical protein ACREFD_19290 [Stellaceae bacterium]